MVSTGGGAWRRDPGEGAFFHGEIGVLVDGGRSDRLVTQPQSDDRAVHPGLQELHGARVPEHVWRHPFDGKGWAGGRGGGGVAIDDASDSVPAETVAAGSWEQRSVGPVAALDERVAHHRHCLSPERGWSAAFCLCRGR